MYVQVKVNLLLTNRLLNTIPVELRIFIKFAP